MQADETLVNFPLEENETSLGLTLMLCPLERRKDIGTPVTRAIST